MYISNCYDEWWPTMTLHCKILTDLPTRCRIAKQRCRIPRRRCRIWDPPGSGWIPLLSPSQQCQSTEGTVICITLQINFQRTITKKNKVIYTKHPTVWWKCHRWVILATSNELAAILLLPFCSNRSCKCLARVRSLQSSRRVRDRSVKSDSFLPLDLCKYHTLNVFS